MVKKDRSMVYLKMKVFTPFGDQCVNKSIQVLVFMSVQHQNFLQTYLKLGTLMHSLTLLSLDICFHKFCCDYLKNSITLKNCFCYFMLKV